MAARGLCAGQAALPRLPGGDAGLQHHPGHSLVHLAVLLSGYGPAGVLGGGGSKALVRMGIGGFQGPADARNVFKALSNASDSEPGP